MPRYNFRCKKCNKVHEVRLEMSEVSDAAPACPDCGEPMVRKFHSLTINTKQPLAGHGTEIYTDIDSATDQLYSMITESED